MSKPESLGTSRLYEIFGSLRAQLPAKLCRTIGKDHTDLNVEFIRLEGAEDFAAFGIQQPEGMNNALVAVLTKVDKSSEDNKSKGISLNYE